MSKKAPPGFQGVRHAYARGEATLKPTHEFVKQVSERDRDHAMAQGPIAHFLQHTRGGSHAAGSFSVTATNTEDRKTPTEKHVGSTAASTTAPVAGEGGERSQRRGALAAKNTGEGAPPIVPRPAPKPATTTPKPAAAKPAATKPAATKPSATKPKKHGVRGTRGLRNEEIRREAGPIQLSAPAPKAEAPKPAPKASVAGISAGGDGNSTSSMTPRKSPGGTAAAAAASSTRRAAAKTAPVRSSSTAKAGTQGPERSRGRLKSSVAASSATASSSKSPTRTGNTHVNKTKVKFEDLPDAKPQRRAMAKRPTSVRHSMYDEDDDDCDEPKKKGKRKR